MNGLPFIHSPLDQLLILPQRLIFAPNLIGIFYSDEMEIFLLDFAPIIIWLIELKNVSQVGNEFKKSYWYKENI